MADNKTNKISIIEIFDSQSFVVCYKVGNIEFSINIPKDTIEDKIIQHVELTHGISISMKTL